MSDEDVWGLLALLAFVVMSTVAIQECRWQGAQVPCVQEQLAVGLRDVMDRTAVARDFDAR